MSDQKRLIAFSGLKHSGKSTLARLMAQKYKLAFADLDQLIAVAAAKDHPNLGCPSDYQSLVRKLFRELGKNAFQAYETRAVDEYCQASDSLRILALGGGTMDNPVAMRIIGKHAVTIFLDAPFSLLFERIMRGGLPAFLDPADPEGSFRQIFDHRRVLGMAQAQSVVSIGNKNIEDSLDAITPSIKEIIHGR